jgi:hypothetical protein
VGVGYAACREPRIWYYLRYFAGDIWCSGPEVHFEQTPRGVGRAPAIGYTVCANRRSEAPTEPCERGSNEEESDDMERGRGLPAVTATAELGSLIACCHECSIEWDIGMQPSRCFDGSHEWTLRVA